MQPDGVLRLRLKESQPELYEALTRSWQVAHEAWLPAIGAHLGSSNSFPHLRNVEHHLDQIIVGVEEHSAARFRQPLNSLELYLLLSAVLFHDIGRTQHAEDTHGQRTADYLKNGYAHLGIPSRELAHVIGKISLCHCPPKGTTRRKLLGGLFTTTIEPFGQAREELLGALLTLADCMDAAYTRALPHYLVDVDNIGPIGLFRRLISGVYVDPVARLVRTVLVPDVADDLTGKAKYSLLLNDSPEAARDLEWHELLGGAHNLDNLKKVLRISSDPDSNLSYTTIPSLDNCLRKYFKDALNSEQLTLPGPKCIKDLYSRPKITTDSNAPPALLDNIPPKSRVLHTLLSLDLVRLVRADDPIKDKAQAVRIPMPRKAPLAIILGDMRNNRAILVDIRDTLASSGILIADWVLERNEHLYNSRGHETYEPLFHEEYLLCVARAMWRLASQVFAACRFTYQELASSVGDPDTRKVKVAAHRIALVTERLPMKGAGSPPENGAVRAGSTYWEWRAIGHGCRRQYVSLTQVEMAINGLEKPQAESEE